MLLCILLLVLHGLFQANKFVVFDQFFSYNVSKSEGKLGILLSNIVPMDMACKCDCRVTVTDWPMQVDLREDHEQSKSASCVRLINICNSDCTIM